LVTLFAHFDNINIVPKMLSKSLVLWKLGKRHIIFSMDLRMYKCGKEECIILAKIIWKNKKDCSSKKISFLFYVTLCKSNLIWKSYYLKDNAKWKENYFSLVYGILLLNNHKPSFGSVYQKSKKMKAAEATKVSLKDAHIRKLHDMAASLGFFKRLYKTFS